VRALAWLRSLWRNLIRRDRVDREIDDELSATFDTLVEEHVETGMDRAAARRAATLALGRREAIKDRIGDVRAGAAAAAFVQDARYGARVLRRNPIFTLTAALSLAIGIGATTTIFTIANGLLLRAAPGAADPDSLVDIVRTEHGRFGLSMSSFDDYLEVRRRTTTLDGVYAYQLEPETLSLRGPGGAERVFGGLVSLNYFTALGITAHAGRVFGEGDLVEPLVVLSHEFWTRRYHADPAVVGQTVYLKSRPFIVAGVAHEGFHGMTVIAPDVWMPVTFASTSPQPPLMLGGRLRPGISRSQASAEIASVGDAIAADRGIAREDEWSVAFSSPLPAILRGVAAAFVGLLMAIVSLVLTIACANVTGVLLARATARRREMAVRVAIGAGRARLVRQLLTETAMLFGLGGAAGVGLARVMTSLLLAASPAFPVPVKVALPLDWHVAGFALALTLTAAVLSGIAPALHASRADIVTALKDEAQGPLDRLRLRNAFVIAQVAFAVVLVVVAGLFGRALGRVASVDRGFDRRGVSIASVDLSMAGYSDIAGRQFARELIERVRRLPGVESATLADRLPGGPMIVESMRERGKPQTTPALATSWNMVEPDYFRTLRIPIVAGRDFSAVDLDGRQPVAIVDESTARRLWPGEPAVGRFIASTPMPGFAGPAGPTERIVVGVARDVKSPGDRNMATLVVYAPLQQRYTPRVTILARGEAGARLAGDLRTLVTATNPNLPVLAAHTLEEGERGPVVLQVRTAALVSATVGLVGLLLASLGVYGVTTYAIAQRTREIGIRITLGADRADVVGLILRQGMSLVGAGAVIGVLLAAGASRVLRGLLFGLPTLDPVTFGGTVLLFAGVGLAACYLPARRAMRISAAEALRYE
jgi:predicted permease